VHEAEARSQQAPARRLLVAVAAIAETLIDRLGPARLLDLRRAEDHPAQPGRRRLAEQPQLAPQREAEAGQRQGQGHGRIARRPQQPLQVVQQHVADRAAEPEPVRPAGGNREGGQPAGARQDRRRQRHEPHPRQVERRAEDQPQAPRRQHDHRDPHGIAEHLQAEIGDARAEVAQRIGNRADGGVIERRIVRIVA
jgi:hypothetical protein